VENAVKYGHEHGSVTAGCYEMDDKNVYIEISDDGPGISEEHLPRIFERFYKGDRARSKADFIGPGGVGSGLGLAIARHVIEAHGGRITAESTVGQGSTFTFTLPVAVQSQ